MTVPPVQSRLLIIEDNPQMAEILAASLEPEGLQLHSAPNGPEALACVRQQRFDAILLDLGLPGMDGAEVLRQLKSDHASAHIPVIVMTGRTETAHKLRAFELGASDYVTKPFDLAELRARLHAVLRSRRLQEELSQANQQIKARAEFLAKTSHEIRTQLGAVTSITGLLQQTDLSPQQRDYVDTILASGESLLTLLNDILNVSKIESGKMELEKRPFHLRLCIDEALDLLAAKCAEKNLDLICDFQDGVPEEVIGDVTRLRQVLFNLISNAVKFTEAGEVMLTVRMPAPAEKTGSAEPPANVTSNTSVREFHFSVRDTGMGIPANRLSRLFQSFSQTDSSITRQYGGTGLGLFISKGLVELMGGKLWAESTEGLGTTFHFTVPLAVVPTTTTAAWQAPQPHLAGRRVLVVDDNSASGQIISHHAQRWGMAVRTVESAADALEWLRVDRRFDLIVVDARMPKMDGLTLAREIRRLPNLYRTPIILLTSIGMRTDTAEMAEAGIHYHVAKPVKPAQLHSVFQRVLTGERRAEPSADLKKPAPAKLDSTLGSRVPLRILLTDDNAINQKVGGKMLNQLGYQPDIARDGVEALAAIQRQTYDVVFMDVQMPGMDGLEATRRIRTLEKRAGSRPAFIVAMTANAMMGDREKCLAAGMDEYLTKPVRPEALQQLLGGLNRGPRPGGPAPATALPPSVPQFATIRPAAPAPVAVAREPEIDTNRLLDFAGGSAESLIEIINLYLKQTGEQIQQMRTHLTHQNTAEAARLAHTCAGASGICGINSLVPLVREFEQDCHNGSVAAATTLLDRIRAEFQLTEQFLQKLKDRPGSEPAASPPPSPRWEPVPAPCA